MWYQFGPGPMTKSSQENQWSVPFFSKVGRLGLQLYQEGLHLFTLNQSCNILKQKRKVQGTHTWYP